MIAKFGMSKMAFLLFLGVILVVASFSLSFAQVFLSPDIPVTIGSDSFEERDIIFHDDSGFLSYLSGEVIGIPRGVNIDAFGFFEGDLLFSVDVPISLSEVTYTERDLILYDGSSFSKVLDGVAVGIPNGARIDAGTVLSDGSMVFSLDIPVTLGGTSFKANDLIKYDGSSFDLYFSGSDNGIPENANIEGVWVSLEGEILFSLDIPCSLNGLEVKDKDIIKWSEGSFSLYFDGTLAGLAEGSDVNALSSGIELCEGDFDKDGDVDGSDLAVFAAGGTSITLEEFAANFGRTDCL